MSILILPNPDPAAADKTVRTIFDPEGGRDLRRSLFMFVGEMCPSPPDDDTFRLPAFLIVTAFPNGRRENGLSIPSEFVLGVDEIDQIAGRIRQLQVMHPDGLPADFLRSMCVGTFRRALCMDDDNHGRGDMDPFDLTRVDKLSDWKTKPTDGKIGEFWPDHVIARVDEIEKETGEPEKLGLTKDACQAYMVLFKHDLGEIRKVMVRVQEAANGE